MPPGHQFRPPKKSNLPRLLAIIGGSLAVLLIIGGGVLLVTGRDDDEVATDPNPSATPTDQPSGSPTDGTSETPSPTPTRTAKPGEVEIGKGVFFIPRAGWIRDPKTRAGASYLLPHPTSKGKIMGWFWARQTELRNAKDFAQHLVDVESNNLHHVVIRQGRNIPCPRPSLKSCYAINYSAVVQPATAGKKPVVFRGLIQAFERPDGVVTATDAALVDSQFKARYPDVQRMIASMFNSF